MVVQFDLELVQLNVKTVFLHGNLKEIHDLTKWIQGCWKRKLGLQIDKITLWIETISEAVVQAI